MFKKHDAYNRENNGVIHLILHLTNINVNTNVNVGMCKTHRGVSLPTRGQECESAVQMHTECHPT